MPFTPFHWGPVLLLGLYMRKYLNFPALMVSAVAVDFRTTLVFFGALDGALHGFFHTFPGATVVAILVTILIGGLRNYISKIMEAIGFSQSYGWKKIFAGSLVGAYSHILLDAMIYDHLEPLYFTEANPFYGYIFTFEMYLFCTLTGIIGILLLPRKLDNSISESYHNLKELVKDGRTRI